MEVITLYKLDKRISLTSYLSFTSLYIFTTIWSNHMSTLRTLKNLSPLIWISTSLRWSSNLEKQVIVMSNDAFIYLVIYISKIVFFSTSINLYLDGSFCQINCDFVLNRLIVIGYIFPYCIYKFKCSTIILIHFIRLF